MTETLDPRTIGIRYLFSAVLVLAVNLFLNATKPIWLAPPLFAYTPLLYVIIMLAWLPLLYCALAQLLGHRKLLVPLLVVLAAFGQWFCWASIAPRKEIAELAGDASAFSHRRCEYTSPEPGQTYYTCELRIGSSDNLHEWILAQKFRVWDGWPLMWLIESDFRIE